MSEIIYTPAMAKALATFQGKEIEIDLDADVKIKLKTGGEVKFKYATLGNIVKKIRPVLKEAGLSFSQLIDAEHGRLLTRIICVEDGSYFESAMPMTLTGDPKNVGGNITYFKRYSLCAALGIVAEDDKDHEGTESTTKPVCTQKFLDDILTRTRNGEEGLLEKYIATFVVDVHQIREIHNAEIEAQNGTNGND
jgi:hypothetical protein